MERLSTQPVTRRLWLPARLLATLVLGLVPMGLGGGCVQDNFLHTVGVLPTEPITTIIATWSPDVASCPDPTQSGKPMPGLAGRVYFFGRGAIPVACDGGIEVQVYLVDADGQAVDRPLEIWQIDPGTLKRLEKRDMIGLGYSLFLPWGTYRPSISRLEFRLSYLPNQGGTPMYATPYQVTLTQKGLPPIVHQQPRPQS
jgi:hypothetical protein